MIDIKWGDCLELMQEIPSGSVDLILCDLPYGTVENKKHFSNILEFNKEHKSYHPTQKPTALLELLIKTYTNEGDLVLDSCMGSGSTGVACARTKRNFIGYELDKTYFEIAKNRINEACERRLFERKTHD